MTSRINDMCGLHCGAAFKVYKPVLQVTHARLTGTGMSTLLHDNTWDTVRRPVERAVTRIGRIINTAISTKWKEVASEQWRV